MGMYDFGRKTELEGNEFYAQFVYADLSIIPAKEGKLKAEMTKIKFETNEGQEIVVAYYVNAKNEHFVAKQGLEFWKSMGVDFESNPQACQAFIQTGNFPFTDFYGKWYHLERKAKKDPRYYDWTCHGEIQPPEDATADIPADDIPDDIPPF